MSKKKNNKHIDRLQEFNHQEQDHYEERKIGDEWYIKRWNGGSKEWQVAVYSEKSYRAYKTYTDRNKDFEYAISKGN